MLYVTRAEGRVLGNAMDHFVSTVMGAEGALDPNTGRLTVETRVLLARVYTTLLSMAQGRFTKGLAFLMFRQLPDAAKDLFTAVDTVRRRVTTAPIEHPSANAPDELFVCVSKLSKQLPDECHDEVFLRASVHNYLAAKITDLEKPAALGAALEAWNVRRRIAVRRAPAGTALRAYLLNPGPDEVLDVYRKAAFYATLHYLEVSTGWDNKDVASIMLTCVEHMTNTAWLRNAASEAFAQYVFAMTKQDLESFAPIPNALAKYGAGTMMVYIGGLSPAEQERIRGFAVCGAEVCTRASEANEFAALSQTADGRAHSLWTCSECGRRFCCKACLDSDWPKHQLACDGKRGARRAAKAASA